MSSSKWKFMNLPALGFAVTLALVLIACGGEESSATAAADKPAVVDEPAVTSPAKGASDESSVGSVTFTVAGNEKSFDHLPESGSTYMRLASTIVAHPAAGSTEMFTINFMAIDLKEQTYPAELPAPKDFSEPMSATAAMAAVGFGYVDADGVEWAGPGKIRVESFDSDGVVQGTFDQVTLPHTDNEHPDVTLTGGTFRARITAPW